MVLHTRLDARDQFVGNGKRICEVIWTEGRAAELNLFFELLRLLFPQWDGLFAMLVRRSHAEARYAEYFTEGSNCSEQVRCFRA